MKTVSLITSAAADAHNVDNAELKTNQKQEKGEKENGKFCIRG